MLCLLLGGRPLVIGDAELLVAHHFSPGLHSFGYSCPDRQGFRQAPLIGLKFTAVAFFRLLGFVHNAVQMLSSRITETLVRDPVTSVRVVG